MLEILVLAYQAIAELQFWGKSSPVNFLLRRHSFSFWWCWVMQWLLQFVFEYVVGEGGFVFVRKAFVDFLHFFFEVESFCHLEKIINFRIESGVIAMLIIINEMERRSHQSFMRFSILVFRYKNMDWDIIFRLCLALEMVAVKWR